MRHEAQGTRHEDGCGGVPHLLTLLSQDQRIRTRKLGAFLRVELTRSKAMQSARLGVVGLGA